MLARAPPFNASRLDKGDFIFERGVGDQLYYYHRTKNAKDIKQ